MKTVFFLFDLLNLKVLENYGSKFFNTSNFNIDNMMCGETIKPIKKMASSRS